MEEKQKNNDTNKNKQYLILGIILVLILITLILVYFILTNKTQENDKELAYTELIQEINDGNVEKIEMTVGSTTVKVKLKDVEKEKNSNNTKYSSIC